MRTLEIILLLMLGTGILRLFFARLRKRLPFPWFEVASVLVLGIQLVIERYRWQMLPAYALLIFLLVVDVLLSRRERPSPWLKAVAILAGAVVLILYLASMLLPILLPIPRLSPPSGIYAVGTRSWHWTDTSRVDPYAPAPHASREIMAQAWYPIEQDTQGVDSPWMASAEIVAPAVADWLNLPHFFLNHLLLVTSQAIQDAQPARTEAGFPVLLFSHGYGGFRAQNTNQMLHLASHGYVVLAVEHTYGAVVTVFPDGRVAYHNPETLPDGLAPAEDLAAARALGNQWASDLSFALDQLRLLNEGAGDTKWQGLMDMTRVGAFGHSTGGGAAIEFCFRDTRCAAILTLDPFVKPVSQQALEDGLEQQALHMFSEVWSSTENLTRFIPLAQHSTVTPVVVSVSGSAHYDFSDLPLLSPLAHSLGLKGPIDGERMADIVNTYLLDYFNQTLRDAPSSLLLGPTVQYPEVNYQPPTGHP